GAMRLSNFAAEVIAEYLDRGDERILSAYSGERFQARFLARRWMRRALRACEHPLLMELAFTLLQTPPLRAIASQVFFSRGSFPDIRWSGGLQAAVRQAEACRSTTQPVRRTIQQTPASRISRRCRPRSCRRR